MPQEKTPGIRTGVFQRLREKRDRCATTDAASIFFQSALHFVRFPADIFVLLERCAMVVQIQRSGRSVTGLHIGSGNVRRYFPRGRQSVDLEIGHLLIRCKLQPDFWRDEPQISDPRLSAWLEAREPEGKNRRGPTQMSLVPTDGQLFRLEFKDAQPARDFEPLDAA
jgi:hypothetical protein